MPQCSEDFGEEENYYMLSDKEINKDFWFLIDLIAHSSGNILKSTFLHLLNSLLRVKGCNADLE